MVRDIRFMVRHVYIVALEFSLVPLASVRLGPTHGWSHGQTLLQIKQAEV